MLLAFFATACDRSGETRPKAVGPPGTKMGGTITVATGPISSLDPQLAVDPSSQLLIRTMCDQLIEFDPKTAKPVGGLAESWTVTSKGSRLIVKLRKGAVFADGDEVTSEDVVFSLSRLASEELGSPAARIIERISGFGYVHGDVQTDRDSLLSSLVGVQLIDSRSFEITLDQPNAEFYKSLAHPVTTPISEKAVESPKGDFVCSGPYVAPNDSASGGPVSLERSTRYSGGGNHTRSGLGYVDRIIFVPKDSRALELDAFNAAPEIDVALVPDARLAEVSGSQVLVEAPTAQLEMIGMPTSLTPFDDPRVRTALSLTLDREGIGQRVYMGGRAAAVSFNGFAKRPSCEFTDTKPDPATAMSLLSEAGVDLSGMALKLYFNDEFNNRALIEEVALQWRSALGMDVQTVPLGWDAFISQGLGTKGFDGAFRFSWSPEYPSPERVLFPLFDTDSIGRDNLSRYSSRDFRESLRLARREINEERRSDAYFATERIVCDDMPAIPIAFDIRNYVIKGRIRAANGEFIDRSWAEPNLRDWYISE